MVTTIVTVRFLRAGNILKQLPRMIDNPYSSPVDSPPPNPKRLSHSRFSVGLMAIIYAAVTLIYLVNLTLNLTYTYPETGRTVLEEYPYYMFRLAVYVLGCGVITWRLFKYQAILKEMSTDDAAGREEFIAEHSVFWRTMVFTFLLLIAESIVNITIAPGGMYDR
jgi:hypothetical protein